LEQSIRFYNSIFGMQLVANLEGLADSPRAVLATGEGLACFAFFVLLSLAFSSARQHPMSGMR
jgi:catechol 2,3-dioxygenase-like lactoylglutathione lyase family enzyme